MLPTALAAVATIYYLHESQQRQFESGLNEAARALSLVVDREIARREAIVRTLAQAPTLDEDDLSVSSVRARSRPTSDGVVLATFDGAQI